jgi:hypothetical protein
MSFAYQECVGFCPTHVDGRLGEAERRRIQKKLNPRKALALKELSLEHIDKYGYTSILRKESAVSQGVIGTSHTDPTHTSLSIETSWPAVLISVTMKALDEFLRTSEIEFSGKGGDRRETPSERRSRRARRRSRHASASDRQYANASTTSVTDIPFIAGSGGEPRRESLHLQKSHCCR